MPRKPPTVMSRKIQVGPCTITVEAKGNPLEYSKADRDAVDRVLSVVESLEPPARAEAGGHES